MPIVTTGRGRGIVMDVWRFEGGGNLELIFELWKELFISSVFLSLWCGDRAWGEVEILKGWDGSMSHPLSVFNET